MAELKEALNAENLLDVLESGSNDDLELVKGVRLIFLPAFEELSNFYINLASGGANGSLSFAVRALFTRSFNDLISSFHLVRQGYELQSYAAARPILESLDLVELFLQQPHYVDTYVAGGKETWDVLSPKKVRGLLGRKGHDEIYGHFSSMGAHPAFVGLMRSAYKKPAQTDRPQIVMTIGGQTLERSFVIGFGFSFVLLGSIFAKLAKVSTDTAIGFELKPGELARIAKVISGAFLQFLDLTKPISARYGVDDSSQRQALETFGKAFDEFV